MTMFIATRDGSGLLNLNNVSRVWMTQAMFGSSDEWQVKVDFVVGLQDYHGPKTEVVFSSSMPHHAYEFVLENLSQFLTEQARQKMIEQIVYFKQIAAEAEELDQVEKDSPEST